MEKPSGRRMELIGPDWKGLKINPGGRPRHTAHPKGMPTRRSRAETSLITATGLFLLTCLLFTASRASARGVRTGMQKGEMRAEKNLPDTARRAECVRGEIFRHHQRAWCRLKHAGTSLPGTWGLLGPVCGGSRDAKFTPSILGAGMLPLSRGRWTLSPQMR